MEFMQASSKMQPYTKLNGFWTRHKIVLNVLPRQNKLGLWVFVLALMSYTQQAFASNLAIQERPIWYQSGELKVRACVFHPKTGTDYPVVLFNHGGISGMIENSKKRCRELAAQGYVVFASSYRGEDGSEGRIEVALGEVSDVAAGMDWVIANQQQLRADPNRAALLGLSHGALISLQLAKIDRRFKAMVFAYGVADIYAWVRHLQNTGQFGQDALTQELYGTGPESKPANYLMRHGLKDLQQIDPRLAILIVQGNKDRLVPPAQAQALFDALAQRPSSSRHARVQLKRYQYATHAFLIRSDALRGKERLDAEQAWQDIREFLGRAL
jgi:dienelactone hydrolase